MNEKDLLKQLNSLKDIKPSSDWKKENREILLKQVFSARVEKTSFSSFDWVTGFAGSLKPQFITGVHHTSAVVALVLIFVMSGGAFSLKVAQNAQPGDSLYMAKIVGEKTQLALAIGEKNKVRLGIEFAGKRAEEINKALSDNEIEGSTKENRERVEKLVSDFHKEIDTVKNRIAKIGLKENVDTKDADVLVESVEEEEDSQMFSANLGKDENGIQVSEPASKSTNEEEVVTPEAETSENGTTTQEIDTKTVTSTEEIVEVPAKEEDPTLILKQAEELLNIEDYTATISKLEEAGELIGQIESGQVKGEEEWASSSETVIVEEEVDSASSTEE